MDLTSTTGTASRYQHYKLLKRPDGSPWELGRGTMGVTYKAFDVNLRCEVALKVVNPALIHHAHARERFIREARAAARLRHRNIASVYHLGSDGDRFFYAMEFIDGETLDALVRRQGPLSPDAALLVMLQVARALAAAARQGVIHRDIKPGNLMVVHEDDDDHRVVKLIDFGLARAAAVDDEPGNLTANGFVGTPVYSSPEQMAEKPADARSDIYSLGVTAWFLLAGKPPFSGTVASIFQQHATKPPPWDHLPAGVPAPVRNLLARMLEKNPARRPQTAVELRQEIDTCRERLAAPDGSRDLASSSVVPRPTGRPPEANPPAEPARPGAAPRELGAGMILKGRYELLRLVGEGNSGQVYEITDRAARDETRALKIFRPEMTADPARRDALEGEFQSIQAAPHANLIRLHAFERLNSRSVDFLVEEWLRGFTLLDLLAVRGGALPLAETLQILAQAASAVDHAAGCKLERLDLSLHQLHVHFPSLNAAVGGDEAVRALMSKPLAEWPRWVLKANPLGANPGGLETSTWGGDLTHLPGATPAVDRDLRLDGPAELFVANYRRALARTVYEILGGASAVVEAGSDKPTKYVSLRVLSEQANAVLQGTLAEEPSSDETCREFYVALATATGGKVLSPDELPERSASVAASPSPTPPASNGARGVRPTARPAVASGFQDGADGSHGPSEDDEDREPFASRTSVSERLALVSNGGRYGAWLAVVIVAGVLVLVGAVILFAVITRHPTRPKTPSPRPREQAATPKPSTSPTVSSPKNSPSARATPNDSPVRRGTPTAAPVAAAPTPVEAIATTPPPLSPTPAPREILVKVRVENKTGGAEISMAGKLLGTPPLEVSLTPGDHQLVAHYRNWPEVRHTLHLDTDQLTAVDEIHMIPPTLVPSAETSPSASAKNRHSPSSTPRRTTPIPSGNAPVHFPSPSAGPSPTARGPEPFLAQPTPARRVRQPAPFDPDGTSQAAPRRPSPNPEPLQTDGGD